MEYSSFVDVCGIAENLKICLTPKGIEISYPKHRQLSALYDGKRWNGDPVEVFHNARLETCHHCIDRFETLFQAYNEGALSEERFKAECDEVLRVSLQITELVGKSRLFDAFH